MVFNALPMGTPIRSDSENGGSLSCDVSKAIGLTSVTQLELSKISLAALIPSAQRESCFPAP